jgi:acyl carrier protein phosphodiesterase
LHRQIDAFTDSHEATRRAKDIYRPAYRLYSGAFIDVVFDHFLANDSKLFTEESLKSFSTSVYNDLEINRTWFPARFANMFEYMRTHDWLYNYRFQWGIEKAFGGLVRRSLYLSEIETAFRILTSNYQLLHDCYRHFWADLYNHSRQQFNLLQDSLL